MTRMPRPLLGLLLRVWPRDLRARHGRALGQTLAAAWTAAGRESLPRRWRARGAIAVDAIAAGLAERRAARRGRLPVTRGQLTGGLASEARIAARSLARRPALVAAVVATLTLGIGATTAIFSVTYGVLFRPLPFDVPDRLVVAWETNPDREIPFMTAAPPNLADWRAAATTFDDLGGYQNREATVLTPAGGEMLPAARMTANLISLLGVSPLRGRIFLERDGRAGAEPVAILAEGTWRDFFGADPSVVGRPVDINGVPTTIVGIMPASFVFPLPVVRDPAERSEAADVYVVLREDQFSGRSAHNLRTIGRLRPGVTLDAAERELQVIAAGLARAYPASNTGWSVRLVALDEQVTGDVRPALLVLFVAVALVLLLACANVAHLLLARALDRGREVAVRRALGAGRLQLARQFLIEGLMLATLGVAGGLIVAAWSVEILVGLAPAAVPRLTEIRIDGWTLVAAAAAGVAAAALASLAPIAHAWRSPSGLALRDRAGTTPTGARSMQRLVLVGEAAVAVVLIVAASLLGRSFLSLRGIDPGFAPDDMLMFHVRATGPRYEDPSAQGVFLETMLDRLRALPAVVNAGTIDTAPLADDRQGTSFEIDGAAAFPADQKPTINVSWVSEGFFETAGIRLVEGRTFTAADRAGAEPVTIVNETFATRYFPESSAVGRRVFLGFNTQTSRRIVGVVGDERHETIREPTRAGAYTPVLQFPDARFSVLVRTTGDPAAVVPAVRQVMREIDPSLPIFDVKPMSDVVAASFGTSRFATQLTTVFAGLALVLAIAGVFGVASHGVAARTVEIGVRVALGAVPRDVRRTIVRPTLALVGLGAAIGLVATVAFARLMGQLLYGVSPVDPMSYLSAVAVVGGAALTATWLPARRATRIDPLDALRSD